MTLILRRSTTIPLFVSLCFLWWGLFLTGCAPKRVVDNRVVTESPAIRPDSSDSGEQRETAPGPGSTASTRDFGSRAVNLARQQLGKMYQWGAEGPNRFDCSGLVYFVYNSLGVAMPRVSREQARMGREIGRKNLQPGDILYFAVSGSAIDHVGIYVGRAKFIHAPRKGMPVRTDSLNNGWWRQKYRGARRIKG